MHSFRNAKFHASRVLSKVVKNSRSQPLLRVRSQKRSPKRGLEGEQRYVLFITARSLKLICRVWGSILLLVFVSDPVLRGVFYSFRICFGGGVNRLGRIFYGVGKAFDAHFLTHLVNVFAGGCAS